jgi:hypothetical protein
MSRVWFTAWGTRGEGALAIALLSKGLEVLSILSCAWAMVGFGAWCAWGWRGMRTAAPIHCLMCGMKTAAPYYAFSLLGPESLDHIEGLMHDPSRPVSARPVSARPASARPASARPALPSMPFPACRAYRGMPSSPPSPRAPTPVTLRRECYPPNNDNWGPKLGPQPLLPAHRHLLGRSDAEEQGRCRRAA